MSKRPGSRSRAQDGVSEPDDASGANLRAQLEQEIGPFISGQSREQVISRVMVLMSEQFSGPIAHPKHLRAYEEIVPGSAERIIQMAEKAQDHNRRMEEAIIGASIWEAKAGMILGASVLLILIGLAVWAGMSGHNILAGMLLTSGMLGGAAILIRGSRSGKA